MGELSKVKVSHSLSLTSLTKKPGLDRIFQFIELPDRFMPNTQKERGSAYRNFAGLQEMDVKTYLKGNSDSFRAFLFITQQKRAIIDIN